MTLPLAHAVGRVRAAVAPDAALLSRYLGDRDADAFAALVRRHGPMVLAVCRRVSGDSHLADDAFQAAFLVLARRAADVVPRAAVGNFLYGVAYRTARDARATAQRRRKREATVPTLPDPPAPPRPDAEALRALDDEVARLPDHLRTAVVLCELEGRPRRDVAAELGVPEGTLSSRLAKARKVLADRLRRRGVGLAVPAAAAVPAGLLAAAGSGLVSPTAARLAGGVFRAMYLTKLKLPALTCVIAAAVVTAWSLVPVQPTPAAPVPAKAGESGIWLWDRKTGKVTVVAPDGKVRRAVELRGWPVFAGFSPTAGKAWFVGRDGKIPVEAPRWDEAGLTLHAADLSRPADVTDLGIEMPQGATVTPDGRTLMRAKMTRIGTATETFLFDNSLVDLATKKETKLDLPPGHQLFDVAPDRTWVLSFEYAIPAAKGSPPYRLHRAAVAGGKPRLLSGTLSAVYGSRISPDGKKVLTFAEDLANKDTATWDVSVYVIDVATATAVRIAGHERQLWSNGVWSPDGKRITYAWRAREDKKEGFSADGIPPTRVVVCDADGKNAVTILTTDDEVGPWVWW